MVLLTEMKLSADVAGGVFNISEIYKVAPDTLLRDPIIAYDDWVGISSAMF